MKSSIFKSLILLILPVALFLIGILYVIVTGLFFLKGVDPEYTYLLNGMLIADLKFNLGFISHPGTPMQCIAAIVIRIVHIFREEPSLVHDVMLNPEFYIKAVLYTVITLNALALFLLGSWMYKTFHNIHVALFLQLTSFTQVLTLEVLRRLMPEPLMNILICGWISMIMGLIYRDPGNVNYKRSTLLYGLLFGISLADKLTFLPFFIIPLILLPGWKYKFLYIFYSVCSFLLFAFPVTLKIHSFYNWVKAIFLHTGSYGGGERGILKWNEFAGHLNLQISNTGILPGVVLFLFFVTLIFFIKYGKHQYLNSVKIKTAIALILVIAFEYLISSKHFAFHYMIPAILLSVTCYLLTILILVDLFPDIFNNRVVNWVLTITGVIILAFTVPQVVIQLKQIKHTSETNITVFKRIEPHLKKTPKIISASYYGCASIEYALTCGIHESGRYSNYLTDNFKKLYPATYIYLPWGKIFYVGNRGMQPADFVNPALTYNLYVAEFSDKNVEEILKTFKRDFPMNNFRIKPVYVDSIHHEGVFKVN